MCNCISIVNAKLEVQYNSRLQTAFLFGKAGEPRVLLATEKANSKKPGSAPNLMATYCPFCGKRYEEQKDQPEPETQLVMMSDKQNTLKD